MPQQDLQTDKYISHVGGIHHLMRLQIKGVYVITAIDALRPNHRVELSRIIKGDESTSAAGNVPGQPVGFGQRAIGSPPCPTDGHHLKILREKTLTKSLTNCARCAKNDYGLFRHQMIVAIDSNEPRPLRSTQF